MLRAPLFSDAGSREAFVEHMVGEVLSELHQLGAAITTDGEELFYLSYLPVSRDVQCGVYMTAPQIIEAMTRVGGS